MALVASPSRKVVRRVTPCGFLEALAALRDRVAVDTETTGVKAWQGDRPYAFPFMDEHGREAYTAWPVDPFTRRVQPRTAELAAIAAWLADPRYTRVYHHAKFDTRMMDLSGMGYPKGRIEDTLFRMFMLLGPDSPNLKLKELSERYLEIPRDDETDLRQATIQARRKGKQLGWAISENTKGKEKIEPDYWMVDPANGGGALVKRYAMRDVERTILLEMKAAEAMAEPGMEDVLNNYNMEIELFPIVYGMESRGIRVRTQKLDELIEEAEVRLGKLQDEIKHLTPKDMNLRSGKQLSAYIFGAKEVGGLGFPVKTRTKKGAPATDADTLAAVDHPFTNTLIMLSQTQKTLNTKLKVYRNMMVKDTVVKGCMVIHAEFNQCQPVTGRFSSSNPNLQNVTNPTAGYATGAVYCRSAFGPRPGYVWLMGDYEQQEPRVFADIAQEQVLLKMIRTSPDIHSGFTNYAWGKDFPENAIHGLKQTLEMMSWFDPSRTEKDIKEAREKYGWCGDPHCDDDCGPNATARRMLEKFEWDIVKAEKSFGRKNTRGIAKMLLFLTIYGGGLKSAAQFFNGSIADARKFLVAMHRFYPGIKRFMRKAIKQAQQDGYITTRFGHRIYVERDKAYKCVDYHVQGSCAGMMKNRMIAMHKLIQKLGIDAHLVMTIHDELAIEIRKEHATMGVVRQMKKCMENHEGRFEVALPTEWSLVTTSWESKTKIEFDKKAAA